MADPRPLPPDLIQEELSRLIDSDALRRRPSHARLLRYLVDVLPVMVTPKWVGTRCQPIAVRDVLRYLVGVLAEPRWRS